MPCEDMVDAGGEMQWKEEDALHDRLFFIDRFPVKFDSCDREKFDRFPVKFLEIWQEMLQNTVFLAAFQSVKTLKKRCFAVF